MADMIDAAKAKEMLGCDDATLNGYINNGSIRAQRVGGKLMLMQEDVEKFARDDGTIVITGDSQDLQIDLTKVADQAAKKDGTQSITFGDDLEVVSFDDTGTKDLKYGQGKPAAPAKPARSQASFTDANTEVMSAVEDPQVHANTDITRSTAQSDRGPTGGPNASARRSVRSSRSYVEAPKIQVIWPVVMLATFVVGAGFAVPFYFMAMSPRGVDAKDYAGNVLRGVDDNFMTNLAAVPAGFSVEPDKARFAKMHPNDAGSHIDISTMDSAATWRIQKYLGNHKEPGSKLKSFTIVKVELDENQNPTQAVTALGEIYKVVPDKKTTPAGDITQYKVDFTPEPVGKTDVPATDAKPEKPADAKPADAPAAAPAAPAATPAAAPAENK